MRKKEGDYVTINHSIQYDPKSIVFGTFTMSTQVEPEFTNLKIKTSYYLSSNEQERVKETNFI